MKTFESIMIRQCPICRSANIGQLKHRTSLGYQRFRCRECRCNFKKRSGNPFNFLKYPKNLVLMMVSLCEMMSD